MKIVYYFLILGFIPFLTATAADWPQWLGGNRDGNSEEKGWDRTLSRKEPLWLVTEDLPGSHSSPAIVGNRCYVFGVIHGDEAGPSLSAYDVESGKLLWRSVYENTEKVNTHASPTVMDGWVYTYDSSGHLRCWNAETGELRWNRNLAKERNAFTNWHGMTCSPLVYDGKVFVSFMRLVEDEQKREEILAQKPTHYRMPGWKPKGLPEVHAFDAETGADVWMNDTDGAGKFPSMVAGIVDGKPTVVVNTSCGVAGLDPETGKAHWFYDALAGNKKNEDSRTTFSSPSTPSILDDDRVLFRKTRGSPICLHIKDGAVEVAWDRNAMLTRQEAKKESPIYYHTSIVFDGMVLVPLHGEKGVRSSLLALDAASGKKLWQKDSIGGGHKLGGCFTVADGVVIFRSGNKIVTMEVSRNGAETLGELTLPGEELKGGWPYCSLPVPANGKLFVRSGGRRGGSLACFDLSRNE